MKKVKNFLKKYCIFLLFIIPFLLIAVNNKVPDNDIWFVLSLGRYVFTNGIPSVEPFTIHEGLNYVMQQWLSASSFWLFFDKFGKYGLLVFIFIMTIVLFFVFYKLCKILSDNKNLSVILTAIVFCLSYKYIVMRPQIFTYLILILELLFLELYVKNNKYKALYFLPFLSLLLVNMHSSMWYMQFVFMLPFVVNSFNFKKNIDKFKLKPLFFCMFFMIVVGFINPYGYKSLLFIFKSYGFSSINNYIGEMKSPIFGLLETKVALLCIVMFVFLLWYKNKKIFDIRHVLFVCGTYLMFIMHTKCYPYFCFIYFYSLAYGFRNFELDIFKLKFFYNKYFVSLKKGFYIGMSIMLFLSLFVIIPLLWKEYRFHPAVLFDKDCEIMANYIVDNYELDNIRLYTTFNEGGYYMFRKIKVYIDPRAEVFLKISNGKADILEESKSVGNFNFNYSKFLKKYKFTHLIVEEETFFDDYLKNNDNYEKVYVTYFDGDVTQPYQNLYVLKDFEVK